MLDAAAELAEAITTQCPEIRILATSREGLAVRGERVMRVASLGDTAGATLFRDRARAAASDREMNPDTLARLSARLDGIPLAIELAAARCASMSPEEIERRLDDRFRLLRSSRRGRLERHQTLRNAVAWSYELLNDVERRVFDRLSAFAGGFTLEVAAAVAGGGDIEPADVEDAIAALVDQSMVLASDTGEDGTRYRLLEMLRQFGEERLIDKGAGVAVRARHVEWFVTFMRGAWEGLWSADDARWIRNVGREFENLRVAVYAAIDNNDGAAVGALLKPLPIWAQWSLRYEVGEWVEAALELKVEPPHARAVAVYLFAFGGRLDDASRLAPGLDGSKSADLDEECQRALARWSVAMNRRSSDNYDLLLRAAETVGRTGNRGWKATVTGMRVATAVIVGRMDEAKRLAVELLEDAENLGNAMALGLALFSMGRAYSDTDPELALRSFGRSRELNERHRLPLIVATAASEEALIIARVGEPDKGRVQLARALRSFIGPRVNMRPLPTAATVAVAMRGPMPGTVTCSPRSVPAGGSRSTLGWPRWSVTRRPHY